MATEWKDFRPASSRGCACGPAAELHLFFVPKWVVGLAGVLLVGAGYLGKAFGVLGGVAGLAGIASLIGLVTAAHAHWLCSSCHQTATPEPGEERRTLAMIRVGALVGAVILAGGAYFAATQLFRTPDRVVAPVPDADAGE